jgi:hypothetical protein
MMKLSTKLGICCSLDGAKKKCTQNVDGKAFFKMTTSGDERKMGYY